LYKGWVKFTNEETSYKESKNEEDKAWPPRFWKFILKTEGGEVAFVDARRLARIRLLDCEGSELRKTKPLSDNGPDPVLDKDVFTETWLREKMKKKRIPVKSFLLDQGNISGIGNWVADETLYNAKLHPEQYTDTFTDEQINTLHTSIEYVCDFAVKVLADSSKFPDDWIFKHRWDKKKGNTSKLPNGETMTYLTVGGRTSAIVPSVQKKTGKVAAEVEPDALDGAAIPVEDTKPVKGGKAKTKRKAGNEVSGQADKKVKSEVSKETKPATGKGVQQIEVNKEELGEIAGKKIRNGTGKKASGVKKEAETDEGSVTTESAGRRRSGRSIK
jgi:formamidopyrimidine-DNA glycosylase